MNSSRKNKKSDILYISYDGLMEPLGESQVLSYLEPLSDQFKIEIISFEKPSDLKSERRKVFKKRLQDRSIKWHMLRYHERPSLLATVFDILLGFFLSLILFFRSKIKIIHIRSLLPGLMVLPLKLAFSYHLIFDMRGFWPEEKVDRAGWSTNSFKYLIAKYFQDRIISRSDKIVTLTDQAKYKILNEFPELDSSVFEVIPTCTDTNKFELLKQEKDNEFEIIFGHLGSVDTAYSIDPIIKMIKNFQELGKKIKVIFFNQGSHEYIRSRLKHFNISRSFSEIQELDFESVSNNLRKIHIGCFFAKYSTSIIGSLPTKMGEFLSSGKPIVCNPANEDIVGIIENNGVGLIERLESNYSAEDLFISLQGLISDQEMPKRCRNLAESFFALSLGVKKYKKIYIELSSR